ncbi:hypothetical protein GGS20DRAFT_588995 [Poronia punctata]|nr:hypothetical protein GGS20DRAFT_588995 [Poronia punctata]
MDSSSYILSDWPPTAIIALSTLLVTVLLTLLGWVLQRYWLLKREGDTDTGSTRQQDDVEIGSINTTSERFESATTLASTPRTISPPPTHDEATHDEGGEPS